MGAALGQSLPRQMKLKKIIERMCSNEGHRWMTTSHLAQQHCDYTQDDPFQSGEQAWFCASTGLYIPEGKWWSGGKKQNSGSTIYVGKRQTNPPTCCCLRERSPLK